MNKEKNFFSKLIEHFATKRKLNKMTIKYNVKCEEYEEARRRNDSEKKSNNRIKFIFNKPKKINFNRFTFLIFFLIFDLLFYYITTIYSEIYPDDSFIFSNEATQSLDIVFLIILSKVIDKYDFYKHQYLSMVIVILMGIVRFIINIKQYNYIFEFPGNIFSLFLGILSHFLDSAFYFVIKKYMEKNYYSPFFIGLIVGIIFSIISSIIYIIFSNINCGTTKICLILSEKTVISDNITILI